MPRDLPIGNGRLLVTFDRQYQIRDIHFPHVGQENHAGAGPCRFGVWVEDSPGHGKLAWSSDRGWNIRQRYMRETLTTSVSLEHAALQVGMYCNDTVDFHRPVMVRKIRVTNNADRARLVKVIHHQDFNMFGTKMGDTAYFDPELRAVIHYRGKRYLMATFYADPVGAASADQLQDSQETDGPLKRPLHAALHANEQRIDEYATGTSGFKGAEGTWRDAEDGKLEGNPIAQGAVDSTIAHHLHLPAGGEGIVYMVLIAGTSREELLEQHKWLSKVGVAGVIDRTTSYWRSWVGGSKINFGNLPPKVVELFKRSLLVVRTQIDNGGAIIAANDSDVMQFSRDTYSYMWPRDGALVANALDTAGFPDLARWFYTFSKDLLTEEGYFLHKYNPDGSPASSWHPWVLNGARVLPIQEDETALVIWAVWQHYYRYRDIEFVRPLWAEMIEKAADFLVRYRDKRTGLPLPSYDLWEERWGVHAFTVATVHAALKAARNLAVYFGQRAKADVYHAAAEEVKAGAAKYLYSQKLGRFVRRLVPREQPKPPDNPAYTETSGLTCEPAADELFEVDQTVDASLYAIHRFGLLDAEDPRVVATMSAVEKKLWVKTPVGGVARYENDSYHRISQDKAAVPGNPWFICTLWLADYYIQRAKTRAELKQAAPLLEWTASHALESGVLAEQVNPYTNEPLSVSPLTWSHAEVVSTVIRYLEKLEQLEVCGHCNQPIYRLRRPAPLEATGGEMVMDAGDVAGEDREMCAPVGKFMAHDPAGAGTSAATLRIDTRDCIGCEICVVHCQQDVLKMLDGKAMVDLRNLNRCDLDGQCVTVCPTGVVSLTVAPQAAKLKTPA